MKTKLGLGEVGLIAILMATGGAGCGKDQATQASVVGPGLVCSPFDSANASQSDLGIVGSIYQFDSPTMQAATSIDDLQSHSTKLNAKLVVNNINVPTVKFNMGFPIEGGGRLSTTQGTPLIEYFSLHLEGEIRLNATDTEGFYQFATISDDGVKVQINDGAGFRNLISDEVAHQTGLACSNEGIYLDHNSRIPFKVDYFQGPREHLTLMLIWRKVGNNNGVPTGLSEIACGTRGNTLFFDPDQTPSAPQQLWLDLQSRGWAPVADSNYFLPEGSGSNPCL